MQTLTDQVRHEQEYIFGVHVGFFYVVGVPELVALLFVFYEK